MANNAPNATAIVPGPKVQSRYKGGKVPFTTLVEDYIHGRIDIEGDFREFIRRRTDFATYKLVADHFRFLFTRFIPEVTIHSKKQDERIVQDHYDRGNDFFNWFLGPRMIYTSAFFTDSSQDLETAQDQKMELVCDKLQLKPGHRMLDIGCGWGTLALYAARNRGADATGVTIAHQGAAYATEQIANAGCQERARILRMDYRDIPRTTYDRISCLEMAEHVGVKYFRKFMRQIHGMLADDGLFYLQIAGLKAGVHMESLVWGLFMNKYIFSGADASMPLSFVVKNLEKVGFEIHSVENVGIHYSITIDRWYDNWMRNRAQVEAKYGTFWFRLWQVFLGWSVHIAAQGNSTCFQIVCNKNLETFNRNRWIGELGLGERMRHADAMPVTNGAEAHA
ncbi:MAG: class I SAM-dependent methyltransferase [Bacteroidetes bacterium]|nr:class I SAM-dependent methyltransferase [Bacteroidota bacterium]